MSRQHATKAAVALVVLLAACAQDTRYRMLQFFFDGVPPPGTVIERGYAVEGGTVFEAPPDRAPSARRESFSHTPFRENRCGSCHNVQDGQLFRTPEEGLCLMCHGDVGEEQRYLHGPVAVGACAFCHHHHFSSYPGLLLDEPTALCLRCHQAEDLTTCPHREQPDQACTQCHNAHGGSDRFFMRSGQP